MADFTPHTDAEIDEMLAFCGLASVEELFATVPAAIRLAAGLELPPGRSEPDTLAELERLAAANRVGRELVCFAGGGAYDHDVASVVRRVAFRGEFVTSYTPYQPEVAQGVLQALFEYQTLVARLSGLPVANASLYDGASATVEAINLAVAATGHQRVLLARGTGHLLEPVPLDRRGTTAWPDGGGGPAGAVVVQYPNYLGVIEDVVAARAAADAAGALLVVVMDPVAMGLLVPPGRLAADVVVGEGQVFGTPLSFGGPYVGLFACRQEHVRRLPGRLVGETVDVRGTTSYVTTLRTREQDIRREKASSNVCTNETLIAVCCAIQLGWLGPSGLREMALRCARGTRYARDALLAVDGVVPWVDGPVLREFAVRAPVPAVAEPGAVLDDDGHGLLIAVTERRTRDEIDGFVAAFEKVMR